ncbi:hypothetical protein, partial [Vibrio diabolicus]|uniref:hypothetical protein n=1 Tax=Vibrio diabolicus TaxID=50719 RepID=UPI00211B1DAE|nr:hypothetical protein [Vibrio diabolicus]
MVILFHKKIKNIYHENKKTAVTLPFFERSKKAIPPALATLRLLIGFSCSLVGLFGLDLEHDIKEP